MSYSIKLIIVALTMASCSSGPDAEDPIEREEIQPVQQEPGHPWTVDVTQAAIEAIHRSIKNMERPEDQRDPNFPSNDMNMPFQERSISDYTIVGYSHSEATPNIYTIDFQPSDEIIEGPSITVVIDTTTKQAIRVYMSPDA